jgi:hypothetical protein
MNDHVYMRSIGGACALALASATLLAACSGSSSDDGSGGTDVASGSDAAAASTRSGSPPADDAGTSDAGRALSTDAAVLASDAGGVGADGAAGGCGGASTALDGVPDSAHLSGLAPPACTPEGFALAYLDDFPGSSLASGWTLPSSFQYGAGWVSSGMVTVHDGLLDIGETYSGKAGDEPVVGWAQLTNTPAALLTYGKLLVRQRADVFEHVEIATLTWPFAANVWPPEVDFVEDDDGDRHWYAFNHYKDASGKNQQTWDDSGLTSADWHTWGIEWTPSSVTYTRDGQVWKSETDPLEIPSIQMYLGFVMAVHEQPKPGSAHWQMDWVALYSTK